MNERVDVYVTLLCLIVAGLAYLAYTQGGQIIELHGRVAELEVARATATPTPAPTPAPTVEEVAE